MDQLLDAARASGVEPGLLRETFRVKSKERFRQQAFGFSTAPIRPESWSQFTVSLSVLVCFTLPDVPVTVMV
jgi:hypothetical protein